MELQLYLDILKRRALVIITVVVVAVLVVAAARLVTPPVYKAETTVRILLDVGVMDFVLREDYNKRLLNTYAEVLKSDPFLERAISQLSPQASSLSASELGENIAVEVIPDTELISISVQDNNPVVAQQLANTLSRLLMEYAQDLYVGSSKSTRQIVEEQLASLDNGLEQDRQQLARLLAEGASDTEVETLTRQIESQEDAYDRLLDRYELARLNESLRANSVMVIAPATVPQQPSNRIGLQQIGLGLVIGLFGGISLALVLENLDTRIHSPQQLEHLFSLPVLGTVPRGSLSMDNLEHTHKAADRQTIEEAYRLLSINLLVLREQTLEEEGIPIQTLLITSAVAREGKSTVAANLAQTFAEQSQTVFLVDGDLRRPTVAETFRIENGPGLSQLLAERTPLDDTTFEQVIRPTEHPSLLVISAGPKVSNPTSLLASPPMEQLIHYVETQGQITLLGAPPVLGVADASVLAPKVDGVILVVAQAFSNQESVRQALKQLKATRARILGLVFVQKSSKDWGY